MTFINRKNPQKFLNDYGFTNPVVPIFKGVKTFKEENIKKMGEEKNTEVELGEVGVIDLPSFDAKPYIGVEVEIATVKTHKGNFGYYVRVETTKVADFGDKEITASKIFGLQEDKDGKIGWGENTKLGIYLKNHKVEHYKELIGQKVILITRLNKDGLEFLDFN